MRRTLFTLTTAALCLLTLAQTPQSFNYQAVVRGADGKILQDSDVSFRFSILEGSAAGAAMYVETQTVTTNQYGLVNLTIGEGTLVSGDMNAVDWGMEANFLKVDMDVNGGSSFTDMSTQQLVAVPYAMHANTVTNSDNDTTNEYQTLSKSGATITLSDGGGDVVLNDDDATNEHQDLSKSGSTISLSDGGSVNLDDDDASNELQTLSLSGIDLTLSDGGGTVSIADNDNNSSNELQTISKTGNNVTLSNGGGTISVADNDNDDTNEFQDLTLSGDSLGLTNSSDKVALNGLNHWTKKSDDELYYTQESVGIGTSNPNDGFELDIFSNTDKDGALKIYNNVNTTSTVATNTMDIFTSRNADNLGEVRGIHNQVSTNTDTLYYPTLGIRNNVFHNPNYASSSAAYGIYNLVQRGDSGTGTSYGTFNYVYNYGQRGSSYGAFNNAFSASPSNNYSVYGVRNSAGKATGIGGRLYGSYSSGSLNSPEGLIYLYGSYSRASTNHISGNGQMYGSYVFVSSSPDDAATSSTTGTHIDVNRSDSGSGFTRAIEIDLDHSGVDGLTTGVHLDLDVSGSNPDATYGSYFDVAKHGAGTSSSLYGSYQNIRRAVSSSSSAPATSLGNMVGNYTRLVFNPTSSSYTASGTEQIIYAGPDNASGSAVRGLYQDINRSDSGSGTTYGYYLDMDHTGHRGAVNGIYLDIDQNNSNTASDFNRAIFSSITSTSPYYVFGQWNETSHTSASAYSTYGSYNIHSKYGAANATNFGNYAAIYDYQTGTGSRTDYGSFGFAYGGSTNGNSRLYGVFGQISGNGDVEYAGYFSGDVYTTGSYLPSDAKLKSNFNAEVSSLDRIKSLEVLEYIYDTETYSHMNLPEGKQTGFIAQDLAKVFPELTTAASQPKLEDLQIEKMEEGGIEIPDAAREDINFTAVNYAGLVPHLTKAIQEQQVIIESQEEAIADMKKELKELKALIKDGSDSQNN